jgi:hypothetical protein
VAAKLGAPPTKLLDEIIDLAAGERGSVSTLLRKCLVLSHALRNNRLREWAEHELNGYDGDDEGLPDYRRTPAAAKGLFVGHFGAQINSQPLPPAMLQERHRRFAESVVLTQPIAAYESMSGSGRPSFAVEWPANLTVIYQAAFIQDFVLNRAWQEIPASVLVGLFDTIKTRVLRLALELKDDLGLVSEDLNELPSDKIDQQVNTYIFGGTNVIASKDFTQIDKLEINQGDWTALAEALNGLGVQNSAIAGLKSALDHDSKDGVAATPGLGKRTAGWLKELGKKSGHLAVSVGIEVLQKQASKWILDYLGLHS